MKPYFFYIVRCSDKSLYSGVTTDLERRLKEHNSNSTKAAKYTRRRSPVTLVYFETHRNRSEATKREWKVKQLSKVEKEILIKSKQLV